MKKLFIVALGVLLVLAFTASAMAAAKVDFSGTFRVRAFYNNNFKLQGKEAWESKRSYIDQRLRIDFKIMPTDNLTLNIGLTTEDNVWGRQGSNNFYYRPYGFTNGVAQPSWATPAATRQLAVSDPQTDFEIRYFWADIITSIGKFSIGRMPGNAPGMRVLGYGTDSKFGFNPGFGDSTLYVSRDKFVYALPLGAFTFVAGYEKYMEMDSQTGEGAVPYFGGAVNSNGRQYDQDWDEYSVTGIYKFANGGVALTVAYDDIKAQFATLGNNIGGTLAIPAAGVIPSPVLYAAAGRNWIDPSNNSVDAYYWAAVPAVVLNFGPVGIHAEMMIATGKAKMKLFNPHPAQVTMAPGVVADVKDSADLTGFAFYGDVTYNYGPGLVGLQYAYVSGDKTNSDYTIDGLLNIGEDFLPFLIAYDRGIGIPTNVGGSGTDQLSTRQPWDGGIQTNLFRNGNHWLMGAWVDHSLTEDLMIHAAFGYFDLHNTGKNRFNNKDIGKHFGHEFDVSLLYTIMNNLTYQLDIGYFWAGDYFKQGWQSEDEIRNTPAAIAAGFDPSMAKVGNAYCVKNTLTLKF